MLSRGTSPRRSLKDTCGPWLVVSALCAKKEKAVLKG